MRARLLLLVGALALALAACSGGSDTDTTDTADAAPSEAGAITVVGTDSLKWEGVPATAELVDGELEVTLVCDGAVPHNIAFEGVDGDALVAECSGEDRATGTVALEPGTYTYYCAIPGHRGAGMEAELTVS